MSNEEVKTEETPAVEENVGQEPNSEENKGIESNTEETPSVEMSIEDFFKDLLGDDKAEEEEAKEETPEAKSTEAEEVTKLKEELKNLSETYEKSKPVLETIEKNPTLLKLVNAVASGKITIEDVFKKFAESQISKPVDTKGASVGTSPKTESLQDRLARISAAKSAALDNDRR